VLFAGLEPDHITWTNLLNRPALALRPTATRSDDQRLTERMRVPSGASTGLKRHDGSSDSRWFFALEHRINSHCAAEPVRGAFP
jgi:hypothetical protein